MTKHPTKAGQLEVGQRIEYTGRRFDLLTKTSERYTVQGEITHLQRGADDRNVVCITTMAADGKTHHARAMFRPLGNLRFQDGESIRVLHEAPRQQEISA